MPGTAPKLTKAPRRITPEARMRLAETVARNPQMTQVQIAGSENIGVRSLQRLLKDECFQALVQREIAHLEDPTPRSTARYILRHSQDNGLKLRAADLLLKHETEAECEDEIRVPPGALVVYDVEL